MKNFIKALLIAIQAMGAGYGIYASTQETDTLSDTVKANAEALANEWCPNGCHADGPGCYCYLKWDNYREHNWDDEDHNRDTP